MRDGCTVRCTAACYICSLKAWAWGYSELKIFLIVTEFSGHQHPCSNGLLTTCQIPTLLQDVDCYSSKIILCESEYIAICPHDCIYMVYDAVIMTCAGTDHHLRVCQWPRSWHSWADYNTRTTWPPRKEYQVSTCDFHVVWMWECDSLRLHVSYVCMCDVSILCHACVKDVFHVTCMWS